MKNEEYIADFCLIAKRALGEASLSHRLFVHHFLLGHDWKVCALQLGIDRGEIFHEIYRVQAKVGRAFRETRPYSLFPPDQYFGGMIGAADRVSRASWGGPPTPPHDARTAAGDAHPRLRPPLEQRTFRAGDGL